MRLQYEIARYSDDESLFAWNDSDLHWSGMFAQSPAAFADSGDIVSVTFPQFYRTPWSVTNRGLAIDLDVRRALSFLIGGTTTGVPLLELAPLHCARSGDKDNPICIRLYRQSQDDLVRCGLGEVFLGKSPVAGNLQDRAYERRTVYIRQVCISPNPLASISDSNPEIQSFGLSASLRALQEKGFSLSGPYVSNSNLALWDGNSATITLGEGFAALLFTHGYGEDFVLILRVSRDFPTIDVLIQTHSKKLPLKGPLIYRLYGLSESWDNSGEVQFSGPLQGRHALSVALRERSAPGQKYYFVDISITELLPSEVIPSELIPNGTHQEKTKKSAFSRRLLARKWI